MQPESGQAMTLAGFFVAFEGDEEEGDGRGGDSRYSGSLADGGGTHFLEFFYIGVRNLLIYYIIEVLLWSL